MFREEDDTGCAGPSTFYVTVAYENSSTWESRIELVQKWREITSRYFTPNWSVITWEQGAMFVDQMLSLKGVAYQVHRSFTTSTIETLQLQTLNLVYIANALLHGSNLCYLYSWSIQCFDSVIFHRFHQPGYSSIHHFIPLLLSNSNLDSGVFGFLSWFGFDLDPITLAALLMSIG